MAFARLFCKTGQLVGAEYEISDEATIGKDPANTIQLYPAVVSAKHARIYYDQKAGSYILEDLKSRNGTKLDGALVRGKERLGPLHVITFANAFDFVFQVAGKRSSMTMEKEIPAPARQKTAASRGTQLGEFVPTPALEQPVPEKGKTVFDDGFVEPPKIIEEERVGKKPATKAMARKTKLGIDFTPPPRVPEPEQGTPPRNDPVDAGQLVYELELRDNPEERTVFSLREGENLVGRDKKCNIVIDNSSISRKHAMISVRERKVFVRDLGSKNHTFVNGTRLSTEQQVKPNTIITFGVVESVLKTGKESSSQ